MLYLKLFGGASIDTSEGPLTGRAVQRHRLALLALLTSVPARGISRDKLIAYLWPEADSEKGRRLLSDSVYRINQAIGADVIFGVSDELRLDPQRLPSDVADFEEAVGRTEWERAVEFYAGPLLDGFFLPDAPEFERWVDVERERFARSYARALEALAEAAEEQADHAGAIRWWRRLAAHDRYDSRVALRLTRALAARGDRAGALQHARVHAMLLEEEFGTAPNPEIAAFVEQLRSEAVTPPEPEASAPPHNRSSSGNTRAPSSPVPARDSKHAEWADPGRTPDEPVAVAGKTGRIPIRWAAAAVVLLLVVALGLVWRRGSAPAAPGVPVAIAVLPFVDLSPEHDQEYFSDGITEELITTLSQIEGLRVASRTSAFAFKSKDVDVREVGNALGVRYVLEGSVRKAGKRLRITAQLVSAEDGYHVWSETYDRELEDVFAIQREISGAIVDNFENQVMGSDHVALSESSISDPEAYNLYLKGRYHWHERTENGLRQAADFFEQAIRRAPDYAHAHVGLGDAYAVLGYYDYLPPGEAFPRAKSAARRALKLDPTLAAAHATLGYAALYYDWEFQRSEQEFLRAIELDPSYSTAHQWYANLLMAMGRFGEAEREMRRAQELDPLSLIANAALGFVYYFAGEPERAIAQLRRTRELNPDFELAYFWSGLAFEELDRLDEAVTAFRQAVEMSDSSAIMVAALARAHALRGEREAAARLLQRVEDTHSGYAPFYEIAKVYVALGQPEKALQWLERAFEQRSHSMAFLKVDPQLASLRSAPFFLELVKRVGLE